MVGVEQPGAGLPLAPEQPVGVVRARLLDADLRRPDEARALDAELHARAARPPARPLEPDRLGAPPRVRAPHLLRLRDDGVDLQLRGRRFLAPGPIGPTN